MEFFDFLVIVFIFTIPFAFFAFVRYLRYKETIALAERGLLQPQPRRRNRDTLRWGIVIMMLGLGLLCGLWPLGFFAISSSAVVDGPASAPIVGESDAVFEGPATAPIVGESAVNTFPLGIGPWMVLGILPFFFGLSLIIIYWLNKREDAVEGDDGAMPLHKRTVLDEEREI